MLLLDFNLHLGGQNNKMGITYLKISARLVPHKLQHKLQTTYNWDILSALVHLFGIFYLSFVTVDPEHAQNTSR